MLNKNLFFLLFCLSSLFVWASCDLERIEPGGSGTGTKFNTTVGGSSNDFANDIITTSDGGYVVVGYSQSFGNGNQAYIVKIDKNGAQEWENNFGGAQQDDYANAVTASSDGGFVFCGSTSNGILPQDVYIVKVNAQGSKVWEKSYGSVDTADAPIGIVPIGTGDFLASYYTVGGGKVITRLLRVNSNGSIVSEKTVKTSTNYSFNKMIKTSDGKIVLVGQESNSNGSSSYVLKLNEDGSFIWENRFPVQNNNFTPAYSVAELPDKSLVLAGSDLGNNDHDFNLITFNSIGGNLWDETWGGASADELLDIARSSDNELAVAGYTSSFSGTTEIYLSKRKSTDGSKIWEKNFIPIKNSWVNIAACPDGGFVVCAVQNQANADIIIVKTDKDGNYE